MVVSRGRRLAWYQGPTLLELLEAASPAEPCRDAPFRFPVQLAWPYPDLPGGPLACLGRVESGRVAVGDTILVLPAGRPSRIATIDLHQRMVAEALAGQSVTLRLEPPANLARGDLLAEATVAPCPSRRLEAVVCWFEGKPLASGARLLLQHGTRTVSAEVAEIRGRLDLQDLCQRPAEAMEMNDIGTVILNLRQPICPDPYRRVRNGGAFILMDEATHATVAAGMVQEACLP
jgi:sulfate adenylyltransferase subunit 1